MSRTPLPCFVITYTDSSFTNPHEVVRADEPPDCRGQFTHMGAKFWGFETDRHRGHRVDTRRASVRFDHEAHHVLHIGLQAAASVDAITVSTRWFTGNQVRAISIDLRLDGDWVTVLERAPLAPDADHEFPIPATDARECRLRCYQEGGISRVNLFGTTLPDQQAPANLLEAATISHTSNAHYGRPEQAVAGHRAEDHMVGWESARTGFGEQALFTLARPARIDRLIVDTYMHRLNPPLTAHLFGLPPGIDPDVAMTRSPRWRIRFDDGHTVVPDDFRDYMLEARYLQEPTASPTTFDVDLHAPGDSPWLALVPFAELRPDSWHPLASADTDTEVAHLLLRFYPNGGIHGLAVHGREA